MPNSGLSKSDLESRIYQILESQVVSDLNAANATAENIADIKRKLHQQAKAVADAVVDEIHMKATVELANQVSVIKTVLNNLLKAIINAPVAPMDGGTTFKVAIMSSAAIPGTATLDSLLISDKIG